MCVCQVYCINGLGYFHSKEFNDWFPLKSSFVCVCVCVLVAQLYPTLCNCMDWSPPGSSIHGILQARILEWVARLSSRGSSQLRDWNQVSHIAGRFFTVWATREAPKAALLFLKYFYYFRVTILYHCIGLYSFELLSYTQIHWPLQYCCKVGVRSRTWFYPITNSYVNLLSFTDAGRKQQAPGSESKECITYGTTSVMNISIFVLLSFCS